MKLFRRILSAAAAMTVFATTFAAAPMSESAAATVVTVSPYDVYDINGGKFEGWGTSLCWWANRVGYSDSLAQQCADTFFSPDGLGLNIARFNIGGGDDPSHTHITRTDSNMPGYTKYNNGNVTYDWSAEHNQRNVLERCIKAAGDDMIVEMFSNSPPYYMTNSGCSTGAKDSAKNNLRDDKYTDFAEYLAEVTAHYENDWGIHVQSITPMNEPYTNYWGAFSNKQEGCHFDQGGSMDKIYQELAKSLQKTRTEQYNHQRLRRIHHRHPDNLMEQDVRHHQVPHRTYRHPHLRRQPARSAEGHRHQGRQEPVDE